MKFNYLSTLFSSKSFAAVLTIIVDDENDNNPKFRRPFYRRSIPENTQTGSMIVSVVADDADKNRTISYSLEGILLLDLITALGLIIIN